METLTLLIIIVVVMALSFDFVNGWNDSANAIATIVATRVLSPFTAVVMAAVLNLAGAMVGVEVANTMSKMIKVSMLEPELVMVIVITGLLSASVWAAMMTILGMPISGSHSLIGGIVGAAVAAQGVNVLVGENIGKTLLAMLIAPVLGFLTAYFSYVLLVRWTTHWRPSTMNRIFGKLQMVSAGAMAFTHGTGDAQKVMGIITMALVAGGFHESTGSGFTVPLWVQLACALAIAVGTASGGWKVIKTLGHHLTKLGPPEGFAAETGASLILQIAAILGIPTSSTHTITGAVLGVGATRGLSSVKWGLGEKIILAWVFTLPVTAAMAGTFYYFYSLFA